MKKNLLAILRTLVFVLPLSMCFVSCEGFDLDEILGNIIKPSEDDYVTVSEDKLFFDSKSSSSQLTVSSSGEWSVEESVDWLTLSPANGVDGDRLVVSVSANPTEAERHAEFTIGCGDAMAKVSVNQYGKSTDNPTAGYYLIPEEYLDGWDNGVITSDKHYFVIKSDTATNGYIGYMNDSVNSTLGLAMYFDEDFYVTKMIFAEGVMHIERNESENSAFILFVDSLGEVLFEEEVELSSSHSPSMSLGVTRAGGVSVSQVRQGVEDAYNLLGTLGDAVAGDWDSALEGLGTDLAGGAIGGIVAGLPGAVVEQLIGKCFNYLKNRGEQLEKEGTQRMLGDSNVEIVDVKRTGIYSYIAKVKITNLATRPYMGVLNEQKDVKVGIYIREGFSAVNYKYKTGQSAMFPIVADGTIDIPFTTETGNAVHYIAPVLLPYRQYPNGSGTDFTGYIRYGEVKKLEGDVFEVQNIEPGRCTYQNSTKNYKFDVQVSATILNLDNVCSWGVDLIVYNLPNSYGDIISEEIGSINYSLTSLSATSSFEGYLPEKYLYKSNNNFTLWAVPFAITDKNEKVKGDSEKFVLEVSGDLCNDANHVHAVDLGLSVKWACCNVGASSPEGYGGYYAWGETEEKSDYDWDTYAYYIDTDGDGLKDTYQNIGSNISGTSYDVAHVKWGGSWRMPTLDEIKELCNKCTWQWTTVNGVNGQKVTGPNGNSIFLPAAGYRNGTDVGGRGSYGYYWSATLYSLYSRSLACFLDFDGGYWDWNVSGRYDGFSVRPVTE